jgi:hypothetical protein
LAEQQQERWASDRQNILAPLKLMTACILTGMQYVNHPPKAARMISGADEKVHFDLIVEKFPHAVSRARHSGFQKNGSRFQTWVLLLQCDE